MARLRIWGIRCYDARLYAIVCAYFVSYGRWQMDGSDGVGAEKGVGHMVISGLITHPHDATPLNLIENIV